ncbi:ABC1 family protein [Cardiosporidium cionae]|uniref:ABC1 family protein n=1 Tax=Cardiosporidium cionae TaxID=476202 RepID=A0ABQ7JEY9_9APIC|nr:ABC1 family protein [Cardiosporidium cionae]|eukprot:KAF8822575.1 ABC1 family protein [Cardiosporidium cionae]
MSRLQFLKRAVWIGGGCSAAAASALWYTSLSQDDSRRLDFRGGLRFYRSLFNAGITAVDYKFHLRGLDAASEEYQTAIRSVHKRVAKRLLLLCQKHGGIYNKFGQYVATLTHVLPREFTDELAVLHDKAPHRPWSEVCAVITEDFGRAPNELFSEIDERPMASASLAQVHRAVRKHDGKEVALKIQYPHLQSQIHSDFAALKIMVWFFDHLFTDFQFSWILPEFDNNLRHELDFKQEAYNACRLAKMFIEQSDVRVPWVDWSLTSKRMLTMEYIRGIKVTNIEVLQQENFDPKDVAKLACRVFAEMLFYHGLVHCDPHPGNLMIIQDETSEKSKPCLVVLDHGMYRRLSPKFRSDFCTLWKAMILQDETLGKIVSKRLEISEASFLFYDTCSYSLHSSSDAFEGLSLIFTMRPPKSKFSTIGGFIHEEDRKLLREKYKNITAKDIYAFLESLPRDILWVFRMMNLVRALNYRLGGTSKERLNIMNTKCVEGLYLSDDLLEVAMTQINTSSLQSSNLSSTGATKCTSTLPQYSRSDSASTIVDLNNEKLAFLQTVKLTWDDYVGSKTLNLPVASEFPAPTLIPLLSDWLPPNKIVVDKQSIIFDTMFHGYNSGTFHDMKAEFTDSANDDQDHGMESSRESAGMREISSTIADLRKRLFKLLKSFSPNVELPPLNIKKSSWFPQNSIPVLKPEAQTKVYSPFLYAINTLWMLLDLSYLRLRLWISDTFLWLVLLNIGRFNLE